MSRITVYDKGGSLLAELDASVKRSWIMNDYGTAQFSLSTLDPKCRREFLEFGNNILIQHEKLPDWGGIIFTPRTWGKGMVTINAYSAMWKFKRIRGGPNNFPWHTPDRKMQGLVNRLNTYGDARVRIGTTDGGGIIYLDLDKFKSIYETMREICDKFKEFHVNFIPGFDENNRLIFTMNWKRLSNDVSQTTLEEGLNIEAADPMLTEQGEIINYLRTITQALSKENEVETNIRMEDSIDFYGMWSKTESIPCNTKYYEGLGTPLEETIKRLNWYKVPRKTYNFRILDVGDIWKEVNIGKQFPIKLYTVGFNGSSFGSNGTVRVNGMSYEDNGVLEVTCME